MMNVLILRKSFRNVQWLLLLSLLCAAGRAFPVINTDVDVRRDPTVDAVEKVMPSVVNIATETIIRVRDPFEELFRQFWDPYHRNQSPNSQFSLGSGVIIDEAGYVLTNDHVVRRADKIAIKLSTGPNVYEAKVVASDSKSDVALLKIIGKPGEKFTAVKFARDDDLLLGETVLALGNPFGLGGSVSRGILSSKSRLAPLEGKPLDVPNWLQTDASINFGNSGGPLVNLRGELIGLNVAMLKDAQGIGFAVPVKRVTEALGDIVPAESVKSFWFGARVKVGTSPLIVTSVQPESPADKAGVKPGDLILQVNGKAPRSFIEFSELLTGNEKHDATLMVQRSTERRTLSVKLVPEKNVFNGDLIQKKLGLSLQKLTPELANHLGLNVAEGFIIAGVEKNSPAAAANLQRGFLVTALDGQTPDDVTAAAKIVYGKNKGDKVQLDIAAQQRPMQFVVGTVEVVAR